MKSPFAGYRKRVKKVGNHADIFTDRVGWWIELSHVLPNGVKVLDSSLETYRQYNTLAEVKSMLKKAPYYVDFINMRRKKK